MANELSKPNKITVGGGLHSRLKAAEILKDIAPKADPLKMPNRLAIVADFSGSMNEPANGYRSISDSETRSKTKLQLLQEAIQDFALRSNPSDTAIAVESFPAGFRIDLTCDTQEVYMRMMGTSVLGDTPMGSGLHNALDHHSPTRCMLISDGEATDGDSSFEAARRLKNKEIICDCVHIGNSSSGEKRLQQIAEITGGMYMKFKDVASFSQNFHYLLPESRAAIAGMLPYERANLLGATETK